MKVKNDGYVGICDARGCSRRSLVAISFFGTETDLHLCDKCASDLYVGLRKYIKEKR